MLFLRWLRWLSGWVRVSVSGRYPERFLNLCAHRGIPVWHFARHKERIECSLFARDYKRLRALRRGCGVTLRLRRKRGLPFLCRRYRHRWGLLVGAALFSAFLAVMPRFVWSIEIRPRGNVDVAAVRQALGDLGLTVGTPLRDLDGGNLRLKLALAVPSVSWAAVNDDGTAVTVEVRGVEEKQAPAEGYANLVATREGQITALYVRSGSAAVRVGDAVTAGQLLVSGTEVYADGRTVFRRSEGKVVAETTRQVAVSVPLTRTERVPCGAPVRRRVVSVFGLTLPLYVGGMSGDYDRTVVRADLVLGGVTLPAWTAVATFTPVAERRVTLTPEQAKAEADGALKTALKAELEGVDIVEQGTDYRMEKGVLTATATCLCRENIARAEPLLVAE